MLHVFSNFKCVQMHFSCSSFSSDGSGDDNDPNVIEEDGDDDEYIEPPLMHDRNKILFIIILFKCSFTHHLFHHTKK